MLLLGLRHVRQDAAVHREDAVADELTPRERDVEHRGRERKHAEQHRRGERREPCGHAEVPKEQPGGDGPPRDRHSEKAEHQENREGGESKEEHLGAPMRPCAPC